MRCMYLYEVEVCNVWITTDARRRRRVANIKFVDLIDSVFRLFVCPQARQKPIRCDSCRM